MVVPGFTGTPNSARILAQRTANNYIKRHPGTAQVILENYARKGLDEAMLVMDEQVCKERAEMLQHVRSEGVRPGLRSAWP
jgi:hypothetical protein